MELKISKWMYLAAVFLFCAATFQITGGSMILGAVLFGAGACLASAFLQIPPRDGHPWLWL